MGVGRQRCRSHSGEQGARCPLDLLWRTFWVSILRDRRRNPYLCKNKRNSNVSYLEPMHGKHGSPAFSAASMHESASSESQHPVGVVWLLTLIWEWGHCLRGLFGVCPHSPCAHWHGAAGSASAVAPAGEAWLPSGSRGSGCGTVRRCSCICSVLCGTWNRCMNPRWALLTLGWETGTSGAGLVPFQKGLAGRVWSLC